MSVWNWITNNIVLFVIIIAVVTFLIALSLYTYSHRSREIQINVPQIKRQRVSPLIQPTLSGPQFQKAFMGPAVVYDYATGQERIIPNTSVITFPQ